MIWSLLHTLVTFASFFPIEVLLDCLPRFRKVKKTSLTHMMCYFLAYLGYLQRVAVAVPPVDPAPLEDPAEVPEVAVDPAPPAHPAEVPEVAVDPAPPAHPAEVPEVVAAPAAPVQADMDAEMARRLSLGLRAPRQAVHSFEHRLNMFNRRPQAMVRMVSRFLKNQTNSYLDYFCSQ